MAPKKKVSTKSGLDEDVFFKPTHPLEPNQLGKFLGDNILTPVKIEAFLPDDKKEAKQWLPVVKKLNLKKAFLVSREKPVVDLATDDKEKSLELKHLLRVIQVYKLDIRSLTVFRSDDAKDYIVYLSTLIFPYRKGDAKVNESAKVDPIIIPLGLSFVNSDGKYEAVSVSEDSKKILKALSMNNPKLWENRFNLAVKYDNECKLAFQKVSRYRPQEDHICSITSVIVPPIILTLSPKILGFYYIEKEKEYKEENKAVIVRPDELDGHEKKPNTNFVYEYPKSLDEFENITKQMMTISTTNGTSSHPSPPLKKRKETDEKETEQPSKKKPAIAAPAASAAVITGSSSSPSSSSSSSSSVSKDVDMKHAKPQTPDSSKGKEKKTPSSSSSSSSTTTTEKPVTASRKLAPAFGGGKLTTVKAVDITIPSTSELVKRSVSQPRPAEKTEKTVITLSQPSPPKKQKTPVKPEPAPAPSPVMEEVTEKEKETTPTGNDNDDNNEKEKEKETENENEENTEMMG